MSDNKERCAICEPRVEQSTTPRPATHYSARCRTSEAAMNGRMGGHIGRGGEMPDPWPLIGRSEEVRRLAGLLTGSVRRGAVLVGGAGVGKTRLARECVRLAEGRGFVALWATATRPTSELPLGAIAHLLPTLTGARHTPTDNRADLLRQSAGALLDHAAGQRLLLVVDDAHLLDDTSAMLLSHLVLADSAFVLATVRSGEPVPDAVLNLWKDEHAERLEVRVLGAHCLGELLVAVLGGRV